MSLNDRKEVRETFTRFRIKAVRTTYTVGGGKGKPAAEVLISNR